MIVVAINPSFVCEQSLINVIVIKLREQIRITSWPHEYKFKFPIRKIQVSFNGNPDSIKAIVSRRYVCIICDTEVGQSDENSRQKKLYNLTITIAVTVVITVEKRSNLNSDYVRKKKIWKNPINSNILHELRKIYRKSLNNWTALYSEIVFYPIEP